MRVEVSEPSLVQSMLAYLRERIYVTAEQVGPRQVEVSLLGSKNIAARRLELDLMLQAWLAAHAQAEARILD